MIVGAWIPIWQGAGVTIWDRSGFGNHGTLNSDVGAFPTRWGIIADNPRLRGRTLGVINPSANESERVDIPYAARLDLTGNNFTLLAWVRAEGWGGTNQGRIISHSDASTTGWSFHVRNNAAPTASFGVIIDGTATYSPAGVFSLNTTHQVAITKAGSSIVFYLNGVEVGTGSDATAPSTRNETLMIGCRASDQFREWDGYIAGVVIANRAWTPAEIQMDHREPFWYLKDRSRAAYRAPSGSTRRPVHILLGGTVGHYAYRFLKRKEYIQAQRRKGIVI